MNTKQLRQKILDLAIRGQLVPQDSNDEPASVLLEKIRAEKQTLIEQKKIKKDKKSSYITCDLSPYQKYTEHFADGSSKNITDEIPFEIPKNWAWCRLGEIGNWAAGSTPSRKEIKYYQKGIIPWLKTGDLNDSFINETSEFITELAIEENTLRLNPIGSVLIAMYGATTGKLGLLNIEATTNQACCACIPFSGINNRFLFFYLLSQKQNIQEKAEGGAQPNISKEKLINILFPLPPLSEQRRIVEKIEELLALVDDLETNKTDLQSYIKQAKSKVLEMAIRGELVPKNPEDEPASVLLERIKNEQKSSKSKGKTTEHNTHYEEELPKNWAKTTLGECFEWGSGGTPTSSVKKYYDGNIPWLVIGDLNDNYINTSDKTITQFGLENSSAKLVPKGTLLLAMYGSIGKLGIAGMPLATNQAIAFALENKEINTKYLFYYLLSVRSSLNLLGKGATQKNISQSIIKDFHFPLPPLAEQHRIVEKIEHIFTVLEELEENIL
jgi:putative restriction-modification enzyme